MNTEKRKLVMVPGPTNVPDQVMRAMIRPIISHKGETFTRLLRSIHDKNKQVFETSNDIVVLTTSGTGGVEASVTNIVKKNDNVIVTVFGEFGERAAEQVLAAGGQAIKVEAHIGDAPRIGEIKAAFEKYKDIKAVIVIYNETSTGVTFKWLKEVGELAAKYGSYYIVDAVSILGGDELPVDKLGVDICIAGSQKCLAAPPGLAILSISGKAKKYMIEHPPAHHFFNLPRYFKYADIGETPFTPSIPLWYALDEALNMVIEEGLPNRIHRHRTCANAFYAGFKALGLEPSPKEDVRSNTVLVANYPNGIEDKQFRKTLDEKYDVLVAKGFGSLQGKVFRIGNMGIVNNQIVLTTLGAISSTLNVLGYKNSTDNAIEAANRELRRLT